MEVFWKAGYCTEAVLDGSQMSKKHLVIWQFGLFSLAGSAQMLFLAPTLDNADPLFALVIIRNTQYLVR